MTNSITSGRAPSPSIAIGGHRAAELITTV